MSLPTDLIAEIEQMPGAFESVFRLVPAAHRAWKPESWGGSPGETFSALEHACHLRDIEVGGHQVRLRQLLEEPHPSLVSLDGYELAVRHRYSDADPTETLRAFSEARGRTVALIRSVGEEQLTRTGIFAEHGEVTLRGVIHLLRSHDLQHLACMHWLLGKIASGQILFKPFSAATL